VAIYDYECEKCGREFEVIAKFGEIIKCECGEKAKKVFPKKAPKFKLVYNPRKDMVDWDGNRTKRYDAYKQAKSEGKKVDLPGE